MESKQPHEKIYLSRKQIFINNLIGGIGWAIGSTIGISVIVALLTFMFSHINLVPVIGNWVADISKVVQEKNGQSY